MIDEQWIRYVNFLLAASGLVVVVLYAIKRWKAFTPRYRLFFQAVIAMLVAGVYANVENVVLDVEVGPRSYVFTVAYAWILLALKGPVKWFGEFQKYEER